MLSSSDKMRAMSINLPSLRFVAAILLSLVSNVGNAAVVTLNPVADTFADSAIPTGNFGGAGSLGVTAALTNGTFSGVIQFNVSAAVTAFNALYGAGNWTLTGAQLSLASTSPNNAIFNGTTNGGPGNANIAGTFDISWIGGDGWTEGAGTPASSAVAGLNWNTLGSFTSGAESQGTFSYNPAASGLVGYTLTPTSGLVTDVMVGGLVSFYLTAADFTVSALFTSRSNAVKPALTLTATPEPGRAMMALLGIVALVIRRRRSGVVED